MSVGPRDSSVHVCFLNFLPHPVPLCQAHVHGEMLQGHAEPVPVGKAAHVFRWNGIWGAFLKSASPPRAIRPCRCHFQALHPALGKWPLSGETGVEIMMVCLLLDVLVGTAELAGKGPRARARP